MAGNILGRHTGKCAACDFDGVHVKQNEGKLPYLHCPDCGLMTSAKNGQQAAGLLRHTRAQKIDQAAPPAPVPPVADRPILVPQDPAPAAMAPAAYPTPAPAAPAKRAGLWDSLMTKA